MHPLHVLVRSGAGGVGRPGRGAALPEAPSDLPAGDNTAGGQRQLLLPPGLVGPRPLQRAASSEEAPLLLFIREDVANDDGMEEEEDDVTTRLLPDDV